MNTQLEKIKTIFDESVAAGSTGSDEYYTMIDQQAFYKGDVALSGVVIDETSPDYIDYLDLVVKYGKVKAAFIDQPPNKIPVRMIDFAYTKNSLQIARENWGSENFIGELYQINAVNSDFEMLSRGLILLNNNGS
jgi:hypothetical protein